jgi:hypothetical protein
MLGGLRVLVVENLSWRDDQKRLATTALILAGIAALVFLARAI